jgi:DNA-binding response OmpR family regulator
MTEVLVVEDDGLVRSSLMRALSDDGFVTDSAVTGLDALRVVIDRRPGVVVLDLGLPDIDGVELLKMIRAISGVPIVVVTVRDHAGDIVAALDAGADDYLVKPFDGRELGARLRAVLRRAGGEQARRRPPIVVGGLVLDPAARTVVLDGDPIEFAPLEFDLLHYLAQRAGEVVSRRELLAQVWHQPYSRADKTLDVHLSWVRRKLGESAAQPQFLHTVRGVGVRLVAPTPRGGASTGGAVPGPSPTRRG